MKILNKLFFVIILFASGCGEKDGSSSSSSSSPTEPFTCHFPSKSHTGCCSSHGGIAKGMPNCPDGEVLYDAQGYVVCEDLGFRSSCTR